MFAQDCIGEWKSLSWLRIFISLLVQHIMQLLLYCCGQCTIANNTNRIVATRKSDEEDNRKQNFLFGSSIWKCYSTEHVPSPAAEARGSMRIICLGATDQETICLLLFFSPRNVKEWMTFRNSNKTNNNIIVCVVDSVIITLLIPPPVMVGGSCYNGLVCALHACLYVRQSIRGAIECGIRFQWRCDGVDKITGGISISVKFNGDFH